MADCAISTAWSPMRSRSPLMRETASRKRRSAAMGWVVASRRWTRSSISICISLMRIFLGEHGFGQLLFGVEDGVDGLMDGALGEASHPEQALLQFFQIMFEMTFHGSSVPSGRRGADARSESKRFHPNRPVI